MLRITLGLALLLSLLANGALTGLLAVISYIGVTAVDELVLYQSGQVHLSQCECKPYAEIQADHEVIFNPQKFELRELQERAPDLYGDPPDARIVPE